NFAHNSKASTLSNPTVGDESLDVVTESRFEDIPGKRTQPRTVDGPQLNFRSIESRGSQVSTENLSAELRKASIPHILNNWKF
ncbi:hypothetical protein H2204_015130, partial [Knufia peltigerae]